jgi:two-component system sensor histidine kinase/response regulator
MTADRATENKPVVLVVDDCCDYLDIVGAMLEPDFRVKVASSGRRALQLAAQDPMPEAVILDVLMPDMDGHEVLRALRADETTREIPAIFMTGLDDPGDELAGLALGAVDYIIKPPPAEVLRARLRTQIELKRMRDRLRDRNEALQAEVLRREKSEHALERMVLDLEAFGYCVSHDLRPPLASIAGFADALQQSEAGALSETGRHRLGRIVAATRKMDTMIDDILVYARSERAEFRARPVDVAVLADEVAREAGEAYPDATVRCGPLPVVNGDAAMLRRILGNLVGNALKFSGKRTDAHVEIGSRRLAGGATELFVRDNGTGFDTAYAGKLFGLFQRLHSESEFPGTGLGLAIVKRLADRHGGRVHADSVQGGWTTFTVVLPADTPTALETLPAPAAIA